MENLNYLKKSLFWVVLAGGILIFIFILLYLLQFGTLYLSPELKVWADLGTYLQGSVGLIIAALNLLVLILLSLVIAGYDTHRHYNELRFKVYTELCNELGQTNEKAADLDELAEYAKKTRDNYAFLWDDTITEAYTRFIVAIDVKADLRGEFEEQVKDGTAQEFDVDRGMAKRFAKAFEGLPKVKDADFKANEEFRESKSKLLHLMQTKMKGS